MYVEKGITVKALRKWLEQFPDNGEVWITDYESGLSKPAVEALELVSGSVILNPKENPDSYSPFRL